MPPKKAAANAPSKKNQEKAKQKVVEDKTFGLKNKKGKKQQTFIKNVSKQVQGDNKKSKADESAVKLSKREQEKKKLEELNELFKPVQQAQKVEFGVDPKSVLCQYFKQGTCQKGNRCKFSHDPSIERKSEKRSIYTDEREGQESMNDWDQQMLEDVVNKKHGASNTTKTNIVCKFFLEAIEKGLYGWFWNCPNGDKCMYKHALPPGFVLKKDLKKEDEGEKISLEELIENERNQLSGELTPVTMETFLAWKKRKIEEKKAKLKSEMSKKKEAFKAGKSGINVSGKEVFLFKPELADADDDEADDGFSNYREDGEQAEEEDGPCVEINLESFANTTAAAAAPTTTKDSKITRVSVLTPKDRETAGAPTSTSYANYDEEPETPSTDADGIAEASGGVAGGGGAADAKASTNIEIDESLFEDMDELDIEDD